MELPATLAVIKSQDNSYVALPIVNEACSDSYGSHSYVVTVVTQIISRKSFCVLAGLQQTKKS